MATGSIETERCGPPGLEPRESGERRELLKIRSITRVRLLIDSLSFLTASCKCTEMKLIGQIQDHAGIAQFLAGGENCHECAENCDRLYSHLSTPAFKQEDLYERSRSGCTVPIISRRRTPVQRDIPDCQPAVSIGYSRPRRLPGRLEAGSIWRHTVDACVRPARFYAGVVDPTCCVILHRHSFQWDPMTPSRLTCALGGNCLLLISIARVVLAGDALQVRFDPPIIRQLMEAFNTIRLRVWKKQPASFFGHAVIEADGTMV